MPRLMGHAIISRGGYRWHKLVDAARHYRIPVVDAHSALGDAKLTLAVVKAMAEQLPASLRRRAVQGRIAALGQQGRDRGRQRHLFNIG